MKDYLSQDGITTYSHSTVRLRRSLSRYRLRRLDSRGEGVCGSGHSGLVDVTKINSLMY